LSCEYRKLVIIEKDFLSFFLGCRYILKHFNRQQYDKATLSDIMNAGSRIDKRDTVSLIVKDKRQSGMAENLRHGGWMVRHYYCSVRANKEEKDALIRFFDSSPLPRAVLIIKMIQHVFPDGKYHMLEKNEYEWNGDDLIWKLWNQKKNQWMSVWMGAST
jgi:hypothetical protein